ncbi:MAG: exodeoxyribonuclease VII large subunit, partial [Rhizobiaceae bacterium]|nr:exodeoxyribonuclease VII large subunit [Rhizobiaceae bacterium]
QFGNVRVRGEISGYRGPHSSGHAYFALKDDRAKLEAVVWKLTLSRLRFKPEEGMEVVATGKLTTYPGSSKYQIVIDGLEPAGAGALMALLEERKRRLAAEGLFEQARKRPLPFMPKVIGVITSPTGAVIRDIIHRIKDRFPLTLLVWPVRVQGETAGAEVTAAVHGFNALAAGGPIPRPDVLIVARGGGSLEDLWGFNDEALARAVAHSSIPVISAVGHETDWTLVDLAADIRAPTPTGAAEIAVPVKADLEAGLAALGARLSASSARGLERRRQTLRSAARGLPAVDQLLALPRRHFDELTTRLGRALKVSAERKRARLNAMRLTPAALDRRIGEARRNADTHLLRAGRALERIVGERRKRLARDASRLRLQPLIRQQEAARERLARAAARLEQALSQRFENARRRLALADRLLSTLRTAHEGVLERGYAVVVDGEGAVIRRAGDVRAGQVLGIVFSDGRINAVAAADPARARARGKADAPAGQGSLF